jgi:hypothetical protein
MNKDVLQKTVAGGFVSLGFAEQLKKQMERIVTFVSNVLYDTQYLNIPWWVQQRQKNC